MCSPKKTFSRMCCCLPLSLFGLIVSVILIICGVTEVIAAPRSSSWPDFSSISSLIVGLIEIAAGCCGFAACVCRWSGGATCFVWTFQIVMISKVLSLIIVIVRLIIALAQKKKQSNEEIAGSIYSCIVSILIIVAYWWITCCFASLQKVLSVGGTGWEYKNYKDIVKEKAGPEEDF